MPFRKVLGPIPSSKVLIFPILRSIMCNVIILVSEIRGEGVIFCVISHFEFSCLNCCIEGDGNFVSMDF